MCANVPGHALQRSGQRARHRHGDPEDAAEATALIESDRRCMFGVTRFELWKQALCSALDAFFQKHFAQNLAPFR